MQMYQQNYHGLSDLTKRLNRINEYFTKTKRKTKRNFAESYSPQVTKFDESLIDMKWLTQFHNGCLLFSLLNGGFLPPDYRKFFTQNLDFSHAPGRLMTKPQVIKGVVHEYKAIILWHILTDYDVVSGKRESISEKIKGMLRQNDIRKIYDIAKEIRAAYAREELFGIRHENGMKKDFAYGGWTFKGLKPQQLPEPKCEKDFVKKLHYLERCPRYSLFCDKLNHWMVFLGCKENNMYFYDSYLHGKLRKLSKNVVASLTISVLKK